jgi:hypothetical protein
MGVSDIAPLVLLLTNARLFFQMTGVSVSLLILTSTAVGAILMMLLSLTGWVRNRGALRERDRTIARLEAELAGERSIRANSRTRLLATWTLSRAKGIHG